MIEVTDPFVELQRDVRKLIWYSVVYAIAISAIAIVGLSVSAGILYKQTKDNQASIKRNQDTIVALCRQFNAHNSDLLIAALDLGIPSYKLDFLLPHPCNAAKIRNEFGIK